MKTFFWKGKAPDGNFRSERISAENAQSAKAILVAQGWSELQLVNDEICDFASKCVDVSSFDKEFQNQLTADEEVRFFEGKGPGFWSQYGKDLFNSRFTMLMLLVTACGYFRNTTWILVIGAAGLGFRVLFFPVVSAYFTLPLRYYDRLNKAKVWGRWDEVLHWVERLRGLRRFMLTAPGEIELIRCRAQALAALGKVDEAIEEFGKFADDPAVPRWTYFSFLSGIYDCANAYEESLECRQICVAENPDNGSLWADLAFGLVHGLNRPAEARAALARAEALEIPTLGIPYLSLLRGVICWREARLAEAQSHFEKALPEFKTFAHAPLIEGLVLLTKSYLCAVLGAQGNLPAAHKYFRQTEKWLQASREDELLEACRTGLTLRKAA